MWNNNIDIQTLQRIEELCDRNNYLYIVVDHEFDSAGLFCINIGGESVYHNDCCYEQEIVGGKYGCINVQGDIQIPAIFDKPIWFSNPNTTVAELNQKRVFINTHGEIAFENVYDNVNDYIQNYCVVEQNYRKRVINEYGHPITREYRDIRICNDYYRPGVAFIVAGESKYGLVDTKDSPVLDFLYDEIAFSSPLLFARRGLKCNVFDMNGRLLFKDAYDSITSGPTLYRNKAKGVPTLIATENGEHFLLDWAGIQQTPKYKVIKRWGIVTVVQRNGKYGLINYNFGPSDQVLDGHEIVPCMYDSYHIKKDQSDWHNMRIKDIVFIKFEGGLLHCFEFETVTGGGWNLLSKDYFRKPDDPL